MAGQSLPAGNDADKKQNFRLLHVINVGTEPEKQPVSLILSDREGTPHPKTGKVYYEIPLGFATSNKKGEYPTGNNVLVPVLLEVATTKYIDESKSISKENNSDESIVPDHGYVYIFNNKKLYRELKVIARGQFKDVNLRRYQGKDKRKATVEPDTRVLIPHKIDGQECKIHIAYSTEQWGWRYICFMGGMHQDTELDPRHIEERYNGKNEKFKDIVFNQALFDERMQEVDLSNWQSSDVTIDADDRKARIKSIKRDDKNYFRQLHLKSGLHIVTMANPVGIAKDLAIEYKARLSDLIIQVKSMNPAEVAALGKVKSLPDYKEQAIYQTAVMISTFVFHNPKMFSKYQSNFNHDKLKEYLKEEEFIKRIDKIKVVKELLIDHISDEKSPHNFTLIMKDLFNLDSHQASYMKAWEVMGVILQDMKLIPSTLAEQHIIKRSKLRYWQNTDRGEELLLSLSGQHPDGKNLELAKYLFPPNAPKNQDKNFDKDIKAEFNPLKPYFSVEKMQALTKGIKTDEVVKASNFIVKVVDKFFEHYMKLPNNIGQDVDKNQGALNNQKLVNNKLGTEIKQYDDLNDSRQKQIKIESDKANSPQATKEQKGLAQQKVKKLNAQIEHTNNVKKVRSVRYGSFQLTLKYPLNPVFTSKINQMKPIVSLAIHTGQYTHFQKTKSDFNASDMWTKGPDVNLNPNHVVTGKNKFTQYKAAITSQLDNNAAKIPYMDSKGQFLLVINIKTVLELDIHLNTILKTAQDHRIASSGKILQAVRAELYTFNPDSVNTSTTKSNPPSTSADSSGSKQPPNKTYSEFLKSEFNDADKQLTKLDTDLKRSLKVTAKFNIALAGFDLYNLITTTKKHNEGDPNTTLWHVNGARLDVAASVLSVTEALLNVKYGKLSQKMHDKGIQLLSKMAIKGLKAVKGQVGLASRTFVTYFVKKLNPAALLYGAALGIKDMFAAIDKDDSAGIIGQGMGATGSLIALYGILANIPVFGWIGLGIAIFAFLIIQIFSDDALDTHLEHAYFGDNAGSGKYKDLIDNPDKAYLQLLNLIQGPKIEFEKKFIRGAYGDAGISDDNLYVAIHTPNYMFGKSTLKRELEFQHPKTKQWINFDSVKIKGNKVWDYLRIKQLPNGASGYSIMLPEKVLEQLVFDIDPTLPSHIHVRAKVKVFPNGDNATLFGAGALPFVLPPPTSEVNIAVPTLNANNITNYKITPKWTEKVYEMRISLYIRDGQGRIRATKHRDKVLIGILDANKTLINTATTKIKKTN